MGPTEGSAVAVEAAVADAEIAVAVEGDKMVKTGSKPQPLGRSIRAPSRRICLLGSGQDVESIISTGKMLIFVLNQLLVHGRIFLNQEIEMSTSSVKILHY